MFEYEGQQYTLQDLQNSAAQQGYDNFDEFVKMYKDAGMKEINNKEKPDVIGDVTKIPGIDPSIFIPGANQVATPYVLDLILGAEDIYEGVVQSKDALTGILTGQPREYQLIKEKVRKFNRPDFLKKIEQYDNLISNKYIDDTGRELDVADLAREKKWGYMGELGLQQAFRSAPSTVVSMFNPAILGVSTFGGNYYEDLENRPDESTSNIIFNSILAGGSEYFTERVGGKYLRGLGDLGKGAKETAVKEYTKGFAGKFFSNLFGGGFVEAGTEALNAVIQETGNVLFYEDDISKKKYIDDVINSSIPAFMMGGKSGVVATGMNQQNKENFYKYVATNKWKQEYFNIGKQIHDASLDLENANPSQQKELKKELDDLIEARDKKTNELIESFDNLSNKEFIQYGKNLDKINKNNNILNAVDILGRAKFSSTARGKAEKQNIELLQENYNLVGKEYTGTELEVEKIIGEAIQSSEIIEQRLKKLKGINREDLDVKILETQEQVDKLVEEGDANFDEKADGIFVGKNKKGKAQIYINKQIANLAGATNVVGHELLHYMISRQFKTDNASMKPLVDELKSYLQKNHADIYDRIQKRIDDHYTNEDGTIKKGALEEYINVFSDLVSKEKIDTKDIQSKGLRNEFDKVLLGFGLKDVKIETAQDLIGFIKNYTENINRQDLLGKLMGTKILDARIESSKLQEIDELDQQQETVRKKSMSPAEVKQVEERVTEIGLTYNFEGGKKLWDEKGSKAAIDEIVKDRLLDNLIASKYKVENVPVDFVKDVLAQLTSDIKGFNPEINNDLGGYLGPRIRFRADDVYKKIYEKKGPATVPTEEKTKEGEVKVQVKADKDVAMKELETKDIGIAAQIKEAKAKKEGKVEKQSKFRKAIGIKTDSDLYNKVLDSARKALLRAYEAGTSARNIQRKLRDEANLYLFKDVKNFLGTKQYVNNLKKFREAIMDVMFTADLVQMEREVADDKRVFTKFVKKLTSKKEVERAVAENKLPISALNIIDKGTAVSLYEKKNVTEASFLSFFDIPAFNPITGKRSGKRGTRKDQLAKYISGALAYDATLQVAQEPDVIEKRQQIAEINNEVIDNADIQNLAAAIDRDANVKFSISNKKYVSNKILTGYISEALNNKKLKTKQDFINNFKSLNIKDSQKELISEVSFRLSNDGRYAVPVDNTLDKYLLKKVLKAKKDGKSINKGIANEQDDANISNKNSSGKIVKGKGDTYISYPGVVFGAESKLGIAQWVSQRISAVKDGFKFTNKNQTTNEDGKLFDDVIAEQIQAVQKDVNNFLNQNNIETIKDFSKKLTQSQIQVLKDFKFLFQAESNVNLDYVMSHYVTGKYAGTNAQSFLFVEGDVYIMPTDSDSYRNSSLVVDIYNQGKNKEQQIKPLQLLPNKSIDVHVSFEVTNNGFIKHRVRPKLNSSDFVKSNVNIKKDSKAAKEFFKSMDDAANRIGNAKLSKSAMFSRSTKNPTKGITVLDFDDTLATTKSLVKYTTPDGKTGTLNAEEYAKTYENLLNKGYKFDFSEFNKVVKGKIAPLFQKALKLQKKFGPKNMFVLTARPPAAQQAIFDFLKANGLNIPINNITGLGNSTAEAKALWIADKVGEGYNDFYFADDALQNVQAVKNMLEQFDVKSKVQQAKVKFSQSMDNDFNKILEDVTGIEAKKRFSEIKARKRGASKGKFRLFIPPSHEDFVGLLYNFMGKGRKGDQHRDFFEQALVKPLNRAYREIDTAKQAIANDYKSLNKQFPEVKKKLTKETLDGDFTFQDAIRVYLWNKHGYDIPGLTKTDQAKLVELVMNDADLVQYAETLNVISKQDTYVDPGPSWETGNIRIDLIDATGRVGRAQYFTEFNENAETIFSPENLNKIEAAYGKDFREALEDMLHAIKTGINRPKGANAKPNMFLNWLNASVSGVMFFNTRSSILQQMSIVNYINFADNNMYAAGKAFANQPQYWKDWAFIFNSDMLKQRRGGIGTDINGAELAEAVKKARPNNLFDQVAIITGKLLKLGFLPTQIGDNIAIATGGATFYRNRINKYIKDGMSKKEAEAAAFTDFQNLTQSTQQSSRPDMTSQQQRSWIGKFILNFQNITSQYNRIIKKAALDVMKGRISPPYTTKAQSNLGNLSKILYYGGIQNVLFYSLQTALFAVMFDDDEDEDQILKKKERVINGTIDSILRGSGIYGAVASTLKNMVIKFNEQREKGYNKDESAVLMEALNLSPIVGIRARGIVSGEKTLNYSMPVIKEMETFDIDNPMWSAVTNYIQVAGFPANRLYQKSINMRNALNTDYTNFQRALFFSGYTTWSLGLGDPEAVIEAKEKIKINKANTKKRKRKGLGKGLGKSL